MVNQYLNIEKKDNISNMVEVMVSDSEMAGGRWLFQYGEQMEITTLTSIH